MKIVLIFATINKQITKFAFLHLKYLIMDAFVFLGSLSIGSCFRLVRFDGSFSSDVFRVVGFEFSMVDFVSVSDLFSVVFSAINYLLVLPI